MGVYIKDTKMPKNGCQDCIFVKRSCKGDICPFLKREVSGNVERGGFQTDCPLIEIPTPHGRLIDADDFLEMCGMGTDCDNCVSDSKSCQYDTIYTRMDFCGWIESAPTIIPSSDKDINVLGKEEDE